MFHFFDKKGGEDILPLLYYFVLTSMYPLLFKFQLGVKNPDKFLFGCFLAMLIKNLSSLSIPKLEKGTDNSKIHLSKYFLVLILKLPSQLSILLPFFISRSVSHTIPLGLI